MKLKVKWSPKLSQDIDALTNKKSPFYDESIHRSIVDRFGSIANYINSEEFKNLSTDAD